MLRLRPYAAFICLALLLCLVGLWSARSQSGGLRRVTNTTEEGFNTNPSLSGDGQRIAFESSKDLAGSGGSNFPRAIRADVGSEPAAFLQMAAARAPAPGISQDGSIIAFAAKENPLGTNTDGNSEIFLFDGSTLRQITNTTPANLSERTRHGNYLPSLTDNGRFIAFYSNRNLAGQNADGNFEIFIFDTTSNSFTQLTNTVGTVGATDAKISGDGSRIAYIRDSNALPAVQRDLILQDRVGGAFQTVATGVSNLAFTYGRAISDDGTRVVYSGETAANASQLFLFDGRRNAVRQLITLGARADDVPLHPSISGDGSRISFATRRPVTALGGNTDNSIELYTYDISTGQLARVTNATSSNADCFDGSNRACEVVSSLNDDGSVVAFNFPRSLSGTVTTGTENNTEIYMTGTAPRPVTGTLNIVNGASFGNEPATTEAVAPDSIAVALGGALSFETVEATRQPDGSFPRVLGGTTVRVNGRLAQLFFVSPTRIHFHVPAETELGTAEVVVTNEEGFRSVGTITVRNGAPGIFTSNDGQFTLFDDGRGTGVIMNADTFTRGPFDPSSGNLRLVIFATGVRKATTVTATAGGRALTVESVMASPDLPGLDEVRVLVPADLRGVGQVDLVIRADDRDSNPVQITFSGGIRDIVINEVLADPPDGIQGDANRDGTRSGSDDEFVELVNTTGIDLNIGGYQLFTRSTTSNDVLRHTFAAGTIFPAGSAIVVFGGGNPDPTNPAFGGAQIFTASTGGLTLNNAGGVVTLRRPSQAIEAIFSYGGTTSLNGDANQSLTRSPDITGEFTLHTQAGGTNPRLFSPGTRIDGTPFASGQGRLAKVTISPTSASISVGQTAQFTAQAFDQFDHPLKNVTITFASDNTSVATVDGVTTDTATGIATATVTGRSVGTANITAQATDGSTTVTSNQAALTVNPVPAVVTRVEVSPTNPTINRGQTQQFTATAFDQNNQPIPAATFSWSSSNTNVATINANGLATGVGIGSTTITATASDATGASISGTATLTVQVPLVINEILADPPDGIAGDANRDNVRDADDDEFVELVNNSGAPVDISGVIVADSTSNRFTFPANTTLAAGRAVVIFGGGTPPINDPAFGGALVFTTTSLSLGNAGDTVNVKLNVGGTDVSIATHTYGAEAGDNQSITRSPDLTGAFVKHTTATNADGRVFSPGTRVDGTPFGSPPITRIEIIPSSAGINIGQAQSFTARAFSNTSGTEIEVQNVSFIWDSSDTTVATVQPATGQSTSATALASGSTTIRARAGGQQGTATLTVNPTLSINDVSLNEGNAGTTTFTFTVSLSQPAPAGGVTFDIATADGTATTANNDYVARSLTSQTIPAGSQTYTFDVTVNGDGNIEPNETFFVHVTNVTGATISDGQGVGTILNDDSPTLSINDVTANEGNAGTTTFTFTVSLTLPAQTGGVTFDIATQDGTATVANNDYVARTLTSQTIPAGQQTYTFDVTVNGDTVAEPDETFFVNVTNVTGATVSDTQGTGTIQNDDTAQVVISQVYGGGGNSGATFTHDFIEIFNRGTTTVNLSGWSVQYNAATDTDAWTVTQLCPTGTCLLAPGQYFLVQQASNAAVGSPLPTPDATGTIAMAAAAGKVALLNTTTPLSGACPSSVNILDLVGYGTTATCFEGAAPAPATSATTADLRAGNGCTDTNNNAADFSAAAPNPRNTSSPFNNCSFPNLTINDVTVAEGNSGTVTATFTVSLSVPAPAGGVTFDISTQDNTATVANNDYVARSLTSQTIPAGIQTYTFDVTVNGDTVIEPDETFFVNVTNVVGANPTDSQGTGTIQNDDSASLSINDVSQAEGNSGTTTFTFTVSLSQPAPAGGVTFDIATADGTAQDDNPATEDNDYVAQSLTGQTISAGQQTYTFNVTVNGDTLVEADETFSVLITNLTGATLSDGQATGTIINDDTANLVISQLYGGGGNTGATYTHDFVEIFNRGTTTIDFSLTPYSIQYIGTTGSFGSTSTSNKTNITSGTIAPGQYFLVQEASGGAVGVALPTPDATGSINLAATGGKVALVVGTTSLPAFTCPGDDGASPFNPSNSTIADFVGYGSNATTTGHCYEGTGPAPAPSATTADVRKAGGCQDTNDNAADFFLHTPTPRNTASPLNNCSNGATTDIFINDVTVTEGNTGTVNATFTVSLSAASASTVTVDYSTADGTATAPADYQAIATTQLVFNPGETSKTITVLVNGDTVAEPNETFFVNLTNAAGAAILDNQGQGTITDDDVVPTLNINDVSLNEGNSGTTTFTFTVSLSSPALAGGVTFDIATQDDTATVANNDYVARSLTGQTIAAGQQTFTFDVTVNGDTAIEANEQFLVNVTNITGATAGDTQGTGTIQNDDSPSLSINDVSMSEGNTGTTTFTFTVSLTQPAQAGGVTFDIATADGTAQDDNPATEDNDYVAKTLTSQTIPEGQQTYTFDVVVNGDTLVEPDETFFVNVTSITGATAGDTQGQGTIQNDDAANLVISQIYPGGGLSGATYRNDFIEIFNRGTTTVNFSITPYSVQFLSTGGSTWVKTDLTSGTIAPGQYFLIQETSGGAVGATLPTPDATGTINLTSTTPGKVALVSGTTLLTGNCPGDDGATPFNPVSSSIVDFVGYGGNASTANHCYEGSGPAPFTSGNNTIADFREAGGCTDTNDNAADFFTFTPTPRNSGSPLNSCSAGATTDITINDVTVTEGNSGTVNATFTVTLSGGASASTVTVDYSTADGTATAPADYQAIATTQLVFNPGETSKTITVLVNGDLVDEVDHTFFVNLTNATNAVILDNQGVGTITDDDVAPTLSINDVTLSEGNAGTTNFTFTVHLASPAPAGGATFDIETQDGTATVADNDYVAKSLTGQTIPEGSQDYNFTVVVNGDTVVEPNETFSVIVSNVTGVDVTDNQGTGTINNDDAAAGTPQLVISQIYGGGSNSGAAFSNDFVQIFNRGTGTVDFSVTPYSVQYASGTGNFLVGNKTDITTGTLAPGQYLLIKLAPASPTTGTNFTADLTNTAVNMSATDGKVALVVGTTLATTTAGCPTVVTVADLVGYGSANCAETTATGALNATRVAVRNSGGCTDTGNNFADFTVTTVNTSSPAPKNSTATPTPCP